MDSKAGIDLPLLSGPALQAQVDLLAVTAFAGALGTVDPTLKLLDAALGGHLLDAARAESFDGKVGQTVVLHTHGRIPAKRVFVVGAGPRGEFQPAQLRDVVATVAAAANKSGAASVGFVLPPLGAAKEPALLQHAAQAHPPGLVEQIGVGRGLGQTGETPLVRGED